MELELNNLIQNQEKFVLSILRQVMDMKDEVDNDSLTLKQISRKLELIGSSLAINYEGLGQ